MAHINYNYYDDHAALTDGYTEGCLPLIALPPIAVIVLGLLMFFFLTRVEIVSSMPISQENTNNQQVIEMQGISDTNSNIAALFTPEVRQWEDEIITWSNQWGLDPNLVATVMQIESCGDPKAVSYAGAMGLFQVMPFHFSDNEDPYKPGTNAYRGLAYLKSALDARGGDIRLAFAGYNGGITGAKRPESAWPAETIRYVYWGTGIYADAKQGKAHSDRLDEWLGRGGASLCAQAASR
jgi:hypothetical protein